MKLQTLEQKIGYNFSNHAIFTEALTHKSYSNEDDGNIKNYERLELLGDAVLELAVTDILMKEYPDGTEGDLSKARSSVVKASVLVQIAKTIELGEYVRLGKGEEHSGGRGRDSILACAMESILGAVYIDGGFEKARSVVKRLWGDIIEKVFSEEYDVDYKTKLQEIVQSKYRLLPEYNVIDISGPSHSRVFVVQVLAGDISQIGLGKNKKEAAQKAAGKALKMIKEESRI